MADAYIGEIRPFAGNFAPAGWALCNGQLLPLQTNTALFSILGTKYGGDGKTNFALPNLMGSAPIHQGAGKGLTPRQVGEAVGSQTVTLITSEIPKHDHTPQAVNQAGSSVETQGKYWAESPAAGRNGVQAPLYADADAVNVPMSPLALSVTGASQPHNNMQPYLAVNYIICLNGYFPPRS